MDEVGVVAYCDLTANIEIEFGGGGYKVSPGDFGRYLEHCEKPFPDRFFGFTTANLVQTCEGPLFDEGETFIAESIRLLQEHAAMGARGLKILKELGLKHRDSAGNILNIDDERLAPVWEEAARLGLPVLVHQADPIAFFSPPTPKNEHYETLRKYPVWCFAGEEFPSFHEIHRHYRQLLRNHPGTTFLLPHFANWPENFAYVGEILEEHPNVHLDFSARTDELGRQPQAARDFLIRHQDRVFFGTDMPASAAMYRYHFRFLETYEEGLIPPDYDGSFGRYRWSVTGLGLPDEVLRKLYHENALRLIPGLREQVSVQLNAIEPKIQNHE